jgi:hypothetical protein
MGAIANMTIETYAMESAVLRAQKLAERGRGHGSACHCHVAGICRQCNGEG